MYIQILSLTYFNYLLGRNLYDINMCDKYIILDEVMIQNKMKFDIPDILNFYSLEKIVMITHMLVNTFSFLCFKR